MEENLDYKTVFFTSNRVSEHDHTKISEVVYDQVKFEQPACDTTLVKTGHLTESQTKGPVFSLLHLVVMGSGLICVVLVSVVIGLYVSLNSVTSQMEAETRESQRQKDDLIRQKDTLIWVIQEHSDFPVDMYCPQNGSCKPCPDHWAQFQFSCYLFSEGNLSSQWKTWRESLDECRNMTADLVVIETPEEQEFISKQIKFYHDDKHGYWLGMIKNKTDAWMWLEKQEVNVTYWRNFPSIKDETCGLNLPGNNPRASWKNTGCDMKNRWICERRALIKPNEQRKHQ